MRVTFHGAAGCVTGSRFLVEAAGKRVLVDCGLFQGYKVLRERNWKPLPFEPASLDAVFLTHAHVDHSGYLPALVRDGFRGPVFATAATRDLCDVLLPDSGRIHEEDARFANEKRHSKHHPALPLYTEEDALRVAPRFETVAMDGEVRLGELSARFRDAGHILGASSIALGDGATTVLFSGDLGRDDDVLMPPPKPPCASDWIVLESTYGDRLHPDVDVYDELAVPIERTIARGGVVLIPAFAVGRTQALLLLLHRMLESGRIPRVPVWVDSPMAREVTGLYREHVGEHRLPAERCHEVCDVATFARSVRESKSIDKSEGPRIVVSASGMLSGGRVLHHLKVFGPHAENLILLPGFQAPGTRGAALADGARAVRVHGADLPIAAEVLQLSILSAHADQDDLVGWVARAPQPPRGVVLVHGEPPALDALRLRVERELGIPARVADHGEAIELS